MSLNLKLQSTASKNQARTIDFELTKLEARERIELLGIVRVRRCLTAYSHFPDQFVAVSTPGIRGE